MAIILLVHGSWHWAGCFHKLEPALRDTGHTVISVNNASHGDDATPWDSVDSMRTYNANAIAALEASDGPVCLVGHSMGGVTLSHLADIMPEKIEKLIYLTAFMTTPGKTANDYIMAHAENEVCAPLWAVLAPVNEWAGIEIASDKPDQVKEAFYADCPAEDIALSAENVVKINTSIPNIYTPVGLAQIDRHYIECTEDRAIPHQAQREMIEAIPGTKTHVMNTSHSPFYSQPQELAAIINNICA